MKKSLWLAGFILVVSMIYGTIYVVTQQVLRINANDPQIQIAEDAATKLNDGASTSALSASPKVDIASSLAPFIMVYDANRQLVAGTSVLNGNAPVLPPGVLYHTSVGHENRLTWQPRGGVRIAAVVVKSNNGYVLAGRSLREVENRENALLYEVIIAWLLTVGFLLAWAWFAPMQTGKHRG